MPKVSVIIPSYNRAGLLPRAIASVQRQEFADLEIVIVDDGSTDDTETVVKQLQSSDPRVRLITHEFNQGEAAARNTGLQAARGEYIAFLDSDDSWLPGKLEHQYRILNSADAQTAAVVSGQIIVLPDGTDLGFQDAWHFHLPITTRNLLVHGCAIGLGGNMLIRREAALESGPFSSSMRFLVDIDWLCRFLSRFKMISIPVPYTYYHKAPYKDGFLVESAIRDFYERNRELIGSFSARDQRLIRSTFYGYAAVSHADQGNRLGFMRNAFKVFWNRPSIKMRSILQLLKTLVPIVPKLTK